MGEHGWTANTERIMKAQMCNDSSPIDCQVSKKTVAINPSHPITKELKSGPSDDKPDKTVEDLI